MTLTGSQNFAHLGLFHSHFKPQFFLLCQLLVFQELFVPLLCALLEPRFQFFDLPGGRRSLPKG
jgi:hypothetical protein